MPVATPQGHEYENAAQAFATQLVAAEQSMEDLKRSHDEALQAAEQARGAVEQSRMRLQTTLAERTKLMSQLEQAKMQEHVASSLKQVNELSAPGNTPSLSEVRDKIEARYANALGQAELAQSSVEGRMLEVQKATLDVAGASRLDQIRASMGGDTPSLEGSQPAAAIEQGAPSVPQPAAEQREAQPAERPKSKPDGEPGPGQCRGSGRPRPTGYPGTSGEGDAALRRADAPAELAFGGGGAAHYLATGATDRRCVRPVPVGDGGGADRARTALPPRHHRVVLRAQGTVRVYDGDGWLDAGPGDFLHVPRAGSTASATSRASRRPCSCCSPRELRARTTSRPSPTPRAAMR